MPENTDFYPLRGWILLCLYTVMAVLAFLILYALFMLQASFAERPLSFYGTAFVTVLAMFMNGRTAGSHLRIIKKKLPLPRLALKPLLVMAMAIFFAGRLFGSL